ncbi:MULTISPECIES: helicase-related protein [Deinococcus]|uniref:Helicase-related protein n=1 Tax=Deinococcus rufus TaxID=2136097 RepID=A0ABV7ZB39_9DEIO|nr:helicase-related protein [Deinococcus sp. AB2017081]WQE94974.1 helicase-related protein [Deinococcus sp. AB2017081]
MKYDIGTMVRARGREWVVQPESSEEFLMLKPLGGSETESTGIYVGTGGEKIESAAFDLPKSTSFSAASSARLLRDAAKLAIRSGAGPFRSLARLGVEPKPYQLVPLLMALRLDPVRLLIADDVGVGKTIEAALIARELIDRGEVQRVAVLCPPHLAEQWQAELRTKFGLDATLVLPTTVKRLERQCRTGQSIFDKFPNVIVSLDFVKSDRWRDEFLKKAPELVIVDEAHTCAEGTEGRSKRHQRYRLLEGLAARNDRHLILVTATPHSGKEDAFRSLLKLLNPEFAKLPPDMSGADNDQIRTQLARHLVQRKRADVRAYMDANTPFPERSDAETTYALHTEYAHLFDDVLNYARESVRDTGEAMNRQRIRWWAALGLLRAMASSPAAAAETLFNRASMADEQDAALIESTGHSLVYDPAEDETDALDTTPGAQTESEASENTRRLLAFAARAEALHGPKDAKLTKLRGIVQDMLGTGHQPIVFCRFIATAEYVAEALRGQLKGVEVRAVTGRLTPDEREGVIAELSAHTPRVLVATDCLSEGINLQRDFSAVIHYDLPWNPTRLEQREGRVDRYGQASPTVRVVTLSGSDNRIDRIILQVLVRKHRTIRGTLGMTVPAPDEVDSILDLVFQKVLLQERKDAIMSPLFELPEQADLDLRWQQAADREVRSRSRFAQNSIRIDDVAQELKATRAALGDTLAVQQFTLDTLKLAGVTVTEKQGRFQVERPALPELRDVFGQGMRVRFDDVQERGSVNLSRNAALTEQLASFVLGQALDDQDDSLAKRAGVIRTAGVTTQTTLLLLRHRFHLNGRKGNRTWQTLAEELDPVAFQGSPDHPVWLGEDAVRALFDLQPDSNLPPQVKQQRLDAVLQDFDTLRPFLATRALTRSESLLEAHTRVRGALRGLGATYALETPAEPDVIGLYIFVPQPAGVRS